MSRNLLSNLIVFPAVTPYTDIANAPVIVGVCCDMCPEKERYMREYQVNLSVFEMVLGTQDNRVSFTATKVSLTTYPLSIGYNYCFLSRTAMFLKSNIREL